MRTYLGVCSLKTILIVNTIKCVVALLFLVFVMTELLSRWDFSTLSQPPTIFSILSRRQRDNTVFKPYYEPHACWHVRPDSEQDWTYFRSRPFDEWLNGNRTDFEALCVAREKSQRPLAPGTRRIAFMFMTRGEIPLEPLWERFFAGQLDKYTIYVHASDPNHNYSNTSLFHGRTIPSNPIKQFGISRTEAVRRLLAYALLDSTVPNAWFTLLCETSIPIRPFSYVYKYLMNSELSFVEAFVTRDWWKRGWIDREVNLRLSDDEIREGDPWISVHRKHAGMIIDDHRIIVNFEKWWVPPGSRFERGFHLPAFFNLDNSFETYLSTILNMKDKLGIANRSVMYDDWSQEGQHIHPTPLNQTILTAKITHLQKQNSCDYNRVPRFACYLFARKFSGARTQDVELLLRLAPALGF